MSDGERAFCGEKIWNGVYRRYAPGGLRCLPLLLPAALSSPSARQPHCTPPPTAPTALLSPRRPLVRIGSTPASSSGMCARCMDDFDNPHPLSIYSATMHRTYCILISQLYITGILYSYPQFCRNQSLRSCSPVMVTFTLTASFSGLSLYP